jgi:hypothetical protein
MNRSGSALYIVLLAIAAISIGSATIATSAISTLRLHTLAYDDLQCEALRADAALVAARFLAHQGCDMRTPIDSPRTPWRIIDSQASHKTVPVHIIVDAWDACSGIPCTPGRDLGQVPTDLVYPVNTTIAGWWPAADWPGHPIFPAIDDTADSPLPLAITMAAYGADRVNWRTAPWPLVEALLTRAERTSLAPALLNARQEGTTFAWPDNWVQREIPILVGSTDRWCLLIDIQLGDHRRTWFEVIAGKPEPQTLIRYEIH